MGRLVRFLTIAVLALTGAAGAQPPSRVALVIANAHYAGYPSLPNTEVDAGLVAASLRRAGFATEVKNDLDGATMRAALAQFRAKAEGAQVALVYFAGHGMESGGRNWLLPTGVQLGSMGDLEFNAIESSLIVQATSGARARVIVLDACRNNPFSARMRGITRDASVGLAAPREAVRGTLFMYSAAPGEEAQDGPPGQGSPFARAFARAIVTPGLDLRRAAGDISDAVFNETSQRQLPFQTSSLSGEEIVFVPAVAISIAPVTSLAANVQVSALGAETAAFEVASRLWTVAGWEEFLRLHPASDRAALARQALASLRPRPAAAPGNAPADPLAVARRALAAITSAEWSAAEPSALISRAVASSSREGLEQLAAQGDANAQVIVGWAKGNGNSGFEYSAEESARLYRLSAAQGNGRGQTYLGAMYEYGKGGLTEDKAEAVRLYTLAATQGNATGQSYLGTMYYNGAGGLQPNQVEAVRLYRLAAAQGNALGQAQLAICYQAGAGGLVADAVEAARLRRLAAAQGNQTGQAGLGYMYETGTGGLTADRAEAIRLYRLAANQGNDYAKQALTRLGETQ